jgi:HK97 family phage portal protein
MALLDILPWRKKESHGPNSPTFYEWVRGGGDVTSVNPNNAMQLSAVYSCVKVLAESIASMPIGLYRNEDDDTKIWQTGHKLNRLVSKQPNDFMTAYEFWVFMMLHLLLRGNSYALILRAGSERRPFELLPLTPDMVTVEVVAKNTLVYRVNFGRNGEEHYETISANDILHLKHMSLDGVMGTSPITYNSVMLGNAAATRDYVDKLLKNDATPRGVLSTEGTLSDDAYERLREQWTTWQSGEKKGSVAILEGGFEFSAVSMSPADVEILEQMKYSRSEIAGIFRVPLHMIADLDRSTNNNIEHQGLDFYTNVLLPWTTLIEQRLNMQLLKTDAQEFNFDSSLVTKGTLADQVESFGKLITMGVMNPNEVRRKLGMNPREGGDEYIIASNNLDFGEEEEEAEEEPDA